MDSWVHHFFFSFFSFFFSFLTLFTAWQKLFQAKDMQPQLWEFETVQLAINTNQQTEHGFVSKLNTPTVNPQG